MCQTVFSSSHAAATTTRLSDKRDSQIILFKIIVCCCCHRPRAPEPRQSSINVFSRGEENIAISGIFHTDSVLRRALFLLFPKATILSTSTATAVAAAPSEIGNQTPPRRCCFSLLISTTALCPPKSHYNAT